MKLIELLNEDAAPKTLSTVGKVLRSMGFKKKSGGDTPGTKRIWMVQPMPKIPKRQDDPDEKGYEGQTAYDKRLLDSFKYNFMSAASVNKFMKDFEAAGGGKLEDVRYNKKEYSESSGCDLDGDGFNIQSQNNDEFGQIVVTVAKSNKAGERFKQGYDT